MYMFFKKRYENVKNALETENIALKNIINELKNKEESLNQLRKNNAIIIPNIEKLINSIANTPKEFNDKIETIHSNYDKIAELHNIDKYEQQLKKSLNMSKLFLTAGASLIGISMVVPNENKKYNEEDTLEETADDELYNDPEIQAKTEPPENTENIIKRILALLGVFSVAAGTVIRPISYYKASRKIEKQVSEIKEDLCQLNKYKADLSELHNKTDQTCSTVKKLYESLSYLFNCDYMKLSDQEKTKLFVLVKYAETISELLHRKLEVSSYE